MGSKVSPRVIGAFVVGGIALGVLGVLFFGEVRSSRKRRSMSSSSRAPSRACTRGLPWSFAASRSVR
jgi:hypothetical protein